MNHTKLPWHVGEIFDDGETSVDDSDGFEIFSLDRVCFQHQGGKKPKETIREEEELIATAEFIVRACNSHYKLLDALKAHEAWEADLILNGDWSSGTCRLTQNQHDKLSDVQDLRNEAIKEAEGRL